MYILDLRYHVYTMRLLFRFLLWLSITVLSLQGSAAMTMGHAEGDMRGMVVRPCHEHHRSAELRVLAHRKHSPDVVASLHAKCPACASCCIGTAPPPALLPNFYPPARATLPHANSDVAMTSFISATLERPPRDSFV
jgi:hypothetical protein